MSLGMTSGTEFLSKGFLIGEYLLEEVLGEGSFGIVYKAKHIENNNELAFKFLKKWQIPQHALGNFMNRFELEYETGKINSKHLVSTYFIDEINGLPFYAMDYCPNGNLQKKIGKISISNATKFATHILFGLNALHNHGKIHRDLKPENVLFDVQDVGMLSDFGITGHINMQLTETNNSGKPEEIFGSYAYMAPEQRERSRREDTLLPAIDIFAFGVVCYEMMTGKLPFGDWNFTYDMEPYFYNAKYGIITNPQNFEVSIPPKWENIIFRCLQPSKEDRYQTTDEIISEINIGTAVPTTLRNDKASQLGIMILNGEQPGRIYSIGNYSNLILIGRDNDEYYNDIDVKEEWSSYISRKQATIDVQDNRCYLRDGQWSDIENKWVSSKNGTYINYIKIEENQFHKLVEDDIILIGNSTLKIIKI